MPRRPIHLLIEPRPKGRPPAGEEREALHRFGARIPISLFREVKGHAAAAGISVNDLLTEAVTAWLASAPALGGSTSKAGTHRGTRSRRG